jgi:cyanophycinase
MGDLAGIRAKSSIFRDIYYNQGMPGYILLEGGAEFGGRMSVPDRRAIELAGGLDTSLSVIPAAAAPDRNHTRAGQNALRWFSSLGARQVSVLPLIDWASANDPQIVASLEASHLIYMLGGFPGYLAETLRDSASWEAMLTAYQSGAVLGGSSAGAMVLCQYIYDPERRLVVEGLGLLPNACVLPHHNNFGQSWAPDLSAWLPGVTLVGIDERTGLLDDAGDGCWRVYGQGGVTLYSRGQVSVHSSGESFSLGAVPC